MQRFISALSAATGLLLVAAALQACSSNNSSGVVPVKPTPTPLALLVPGSTASYSGTQTATVTFASPGPKSPNSSAAYTTTETDTVAAASASAPAPFEVTRTTTYAVASSKTPSYGIAPATLTVNDFENVSTQTGGTQAVTLTQSISNETGTNVTSILNNGGSGAYTANTTTTYSPNTILAIYPLSAGLSWSTNESRTVAAQTSTTTASTTQSTNINTTFQADDSFTETGTLANTDTTSRTEMSSGAATVTDTGPKPFSESISVPSTTCNSSTTGTYTIPVVQNSTNYCAADWYPGNAAPPAPLGSTIFTVVGPATSLPSGCSVTGQFSNIVEYTATTNTVNVIGGNVTTSTAQVFDSNGLTLCRLTSGTTQHYDVTTGLLARTDQTSTTQSLGSFTTSSKARAQK